MPLTPVIPTTGVAGWSFLQRTLEQQTEVFNRSPDIALQLEYFEENIGAVETLDDLMGDRRLLQVALGAFGLEEELDKGAFVRKMLEEGTEDSSAFAVRINNSDYIDLVEFVGVDSEGGVSFSESDIATMKSQFQRQSFETEVGTVNDTMRLALNFEREIADIAGQDLSENAGWFRAIGSIPLRTVIEGAFNLPEEFSALDIDRQKEILSDNANKLFGEKTVDVFSDPENVQTMINRYLLREQINSGPSASTPGYAALSILTNGSSSLSSSGIANLLLSTSYGV
jgi:hypothetical protein